MGLNGKQRSYLRALAHHRKVVVTLGQAGFTPAVQAEIEQALQRHELLKIKLSGDREARKQALGQICQATTAQPIQEIGRIAIIYRPSEKPQIQLPQV